MWVATAGLLSALLVGVALAAQIPVGLALLLGPFYAVLVFVNLSLGLALWVPLAFLEGIPELNIAGKAAGLMIAMAWLGSLQSRREAVIATFRSHRVPSVILVGILVWFSLSLAWSDDPGLGFDDVWHWYVLALLFAVIVTTVTTAHALRLVLAGFVFGAVASVGIGVLDGSLTSAIDGGARFEGGAGDPNFLAASIIPATVLAAALLSEARSSLVRGLFLGAIVMLVAGIVASGSRGGALAAGVTIVAAFIFFKRRRVEVAAVAAVVLGIAALTFVNAPGAWERVTSFDDDNGRSDLWTVAWRVGEDEPVTGVGLNNFRVHSPDYVREPGALEDVRLIVDDPHLVHNTYLQLFAEGGVVGLALFLGFAGACLSATKLAADRFEAQGERSLGTLARAAMVATVSMLAAAVFLSAAADKRLWLLLALGPALLAVASRERDEASVWRKSARPW
jgi:O-antigen ligase